MLISLSLKVCSLLELFDDDDDDDDEKYIVIL